MGIDISVNFSSDETLESEVTIDAYLIEKIAAEIVAIDKAFGPDRSIGPVRCLIRANETLVLIGTQKQGDQEYYVDEYGALIKGYPPKEKE